MTTTLGAALAAFDLDPADLPGIEQAWEDRFGILNTEAPETDADVLRRIHPDVSDWAGLTIYALTPHADGDLTVSFEGRDREGDDATGHVRLGAEHARELLLAREGEDDTYRRRRLTAERDQYTSGAQPVWWLLTGNPDATKATFVDEDRALDNAKDTCERAAELARRTAQLDKALRTLKAIDAKELVLFPTSGRTSRGVTPLSEPKKRNTWGDDPRAVKVNEVNDAIKALLETTPHFEQVSAAYAEATALPDGPLKEFLLGERDLVEYRVMEGTKRYPVEVTRSYRPTSDLVKGHKTAAEKHLRAEQVRDDIQERLALISDEARVAHILRKANVDAAKKTWARAWSAGFPGKKAPKPLPGKGYADIW